MQKIRRALRVRGGGKDGALIVLKRFEPMLAAGLTRIFLLAARLCIWESGGLVYKSDCHDRIRIQLEGGSDVGAPIKPPSGMLGVHVRESGIDRQQRRAELFSEQLIGIEKSL